jgi:protein deglycase
MSLNPASEQNRSPEIESLESRHKDTLPKDLTMVLWTSVVAKRSYTRTTLLTGLAITSASSFVNHIAFALRASSIPNDLRFKSFKSFKIRSASSLAMSKQVLVPIADGSEEIETACITDTLTRFGAAVTVASVMPSASSDSASLTCTMSRGLKVAADCSIQEAIAKGTDYWDMVVLPGGMPGATHLRDSPPLIELLKHQKGTSGKYYAAICASPAVVLASHGLIDAGAKVTGYPAPAFLAALEQQDVSPEAVVVHDNLTTGQGPASALDFALSLGETLFGKEKRDEIAKEMLKA